MEDDRLQAILKDFPGTNLQLLCLDHRSGASFTFVIKKKKKKGGQFCFLAFVVIAVEAVMKAVKREARGKSRGI